MKFNKNEFGWKEKVSVNTDELVTKEYVDENTQLCWLEDYEATGDRLQYADVNVSSLTSRVFYAFNFKKHPGVKTVRLLKSYDDGTIKSIINLSSTLEYMYLMNISSSIMKFYLKYATGIVSECVCTFGNTSDECTFKRTPMVLYAKNTYEYTPTTDYNPATKKYVDDKFIALDLMETVGTIPQSELQKCNNGTSRYVSSIDFDTLFSEPNNYMYYATYKDDTLIPIDYQSNFNRMVTRELDSVDGEGIYIGFDYGTHMMYPFNGGNASIKAYTFTNDLIIKRCPLINVNEVATKKYVDDTIDNSLSSADAKAIATGIYNTQLQIFDGKLMDNVTYYQSADYNVTPAKNGIYVININKTLDNIGINDRVHIAYKYKLNREEKTYATSWKIYATTGTIVSTVAYFGSYQVLIEIVVKQEYVDVLTTVDNANTCGISLAFHNSIPVDIVNEIANSLEISLGIGSLNVLTLDNKEEYTPTLNYNPATKKYVDDTISNILSFNESGELVVTINGVSKTFVPKQ